MKFIVSMSMSLIFSTLSIAAPDAINGTWDGYSRPEIFGTNLNNELSALPLEGGLESTARAWSGDYWASNKGGINYRWNAPKKTGWGYKSPARHEVARMGIGQLATLSPSEKFDLYMGRYDYPLKREVEGTTSKMAQDWAGICHGWAPASAFHNEPTPKVVTNPDGIQIPFGSADIKALLSYFYANYYKADSDQIGLRCYYGGRTCTDDLNAGAFHIVMANKLGLNKESFMMDVDRRRQVWNQPTIGYKSIILAHNLRPSSKSAPSTVREMRVSTQIFYVNESRPTWETVLGTENQIVAKKDLQYRLELNAYGQIVGGAWESSDRPDFLWNIPAATAEQFGGLLTDLPTLLND